MDLVTGGTGLVGSHLILSLLSEGNQVRALKRQQSSLSWIKRIFRYYEPEKGDELFRRIGWVNADLTDHDALESAFRGIERVFHSAALVSFNPRDRGKLMRVNRDGTRDMVNFALENGVKYFGFVSSVAALGMKYHNGEYRVAEPEEWKNTGDKPDYAVSKFLAELEVWRGIEEGLTAGIVNPSVIIGPGDWFRGSGALFRRISRGLPFYPAGATGFVDVRDVANILRIMAEQKISKDRYLLSSENLSYKDVFTMIARSFGKKEPQYRVTPLVGSLAWRVDRAVSMITRKPHDITRFSVRAGARKVVYDTSKIRQEMHYRFIPVSEAIENTTSFYKRMVTGEI